MSEVRIVGTAHKAPTDVTDVDWIGMWDHVKNQGQCESC